MKIYRSHTDQPLLGSPQSCRLKPAIQFAATGVPDGLLTMNPTLHKASAFSLVEITLALGVAAFCLITVLGLVPIALKTQQASIQQTTANQILSQQAADLRASVRYPPGLAQQLNDQQKVLRGHWAEVGQPDTLYYTNEGAQTGGLTPATPPTDAVFRLTLTYLSPPVETTALANIKVSWPAQVDLATGTPAGSVQTFIAINR
jgi:type II secretory pathway pseudopilin PulG